MRLFNALLLISGISKGFSASQIQASGSPLRIPAFTYNRTDFLLNGMPYQIIGGQMDPQRIPPQYWRDRLKKARAMGLNTIFSYVFWNMLEPVQGKWDNTDENDIAEFFRIAEQEQLKIVLRPGPYICGERDWGGFPAWLASVPGMIVRSNNPLFLKASRRFIERLAVDIRELQSTRGGPILMVQVENEYGSYGRDHNYTAALLDILRTTFDNGTVFYTNDGSEDWTLEGGSVPGVLAEIDGNPYGFDALEKYITDPSQKGPLLDGEYYSWAPDIWGAANPHNGPQGDTIAGFVNDLNYVLGTKAASISLYMFHGGTNFGFSNGALWQNQTKVWTSSYDYGSPLDESGRTTDSYNMFRQTIQQYSKVGSIPDAPPNHPMLEIPEFKLTPSMQLFDIPEKNTSGKFPMTMEALGQDYGFTLYEHTITAPASGVIQPGDHARDRVIIYVNGNRTGVIDSQYKKPLAVNVTLEIGDKLQLLVENLGRVNYYSRGTPYENRVTDPYKGIVGNVTIGETMIQDWNMFTFPLSDISFIKSVRSHANLAVNNSSQTTPVFYQGSFHVPKNFTEQMELDSYLAFAAGVKGNVWVNRFNLGRYWRVGPQQSLYLPGTVLKPGEENHVVVLELEPDRVKGEMAGKGLAQRTPPLATIRRARQGLWSKKVPCSEVAAPETGIHSLEWASRISPNTSLLIRCSPELRSSILEDVIKGIDGKISPYKARDKFSNNHSKKLGTMMIGLYTLCRQAYVDIYGAALLYRLKEFHFVTSDSMLNYLSVINPHHRNAIRTVTLDLKLRNGTQRATTELTWSMLQSMDSLESLYILIVHPRHMWTPGAPSSVSLLRNPYLQGLEKISGLKNFELRLQNGHVDPQNQEGCRNNQE